MDQEKEDIGYHLVKGMNQKMNYFVNQQYVVDLECNIPTRQVNVDQDIDTRLISYRDQLQMIDEYVNQRKVHFDGQRFLGVEKASALFFPFSRTDILLWRNIIQSGNTTKQHYEACSLRHINIVVNSYSMFHYFAEDSKVIEMFCKKFLQAKRNNELKDTEHNLPLQIMNRDREGQTAIYLAVQSQCTKSVENMMQILIDFKEITLTKMVLTSMSTIINANLDSVQ